MDNMYDSNIRIAEVVLGLEQRPSENQRNPACSILEDSLFLLHLPIDAEIVLLRLRTVVIVLMQVRIHLRVSI